MINFVCDIETDKIVKIYKQRKRAENMLTDLRLCVKSFNPAFYPGVTKLKEGDILTY